MKNNLSTPVIVAVIALAVIILGVILFKGTSGTSTAPKPDPSGFLPSGAKVEGSRTP